MRQQAYAELADRHAEVSEWFGKMADWHNVVSWRQTDAEYFRKLEGEMFAIALVYRRMAQGEARRMQMKRTILTGLVLALLLLLLMAGLPAVAQDAIPTPSPATLHGEGNTVAIQPVQAMEATLEPTPSGPPVVVIESPQSTAMFYVFSAVIFGLLAVIVLVLRPLIVQLGASAPSWAVDAAFSAGNTLIKSAQDYAGTTPSTLDDDLILELQKEIKALKTQIDGLRQGSTPGGVG